MNCSKLVYERALKHEFHSGLVICDSERKRQAKLLPHEVTFSRAPRRDGRTGLTENTGIASSVVMETYNAQV